MKFRVLVSKITQSPLITVEVVAKDHHDAMIQAENKAMNLPFPLETEWDTHIEAQYATKIPLYIKRKKPS
jgi:hypothetical protein